jgi:hypothetical protein
VREILLKSGAVVGNGSIFQEVRPEDKMATDLWKGSIIREKHDFSMSF